jgi:predicted nucleotidyltransferase
MVKRELDVDVILEFRSLELFLDVVKRELELIKLLSLRIEILELKSLEVSNE